MTLKLMKSKHKDENKFIEDVVAAVLGSPKMESFITSRCEAIFDAKKGRDIPIETFNKIVSAAVEEIERRRRENDEAAQSTQAPSIKKLYASIYNVEENRFQSVSNDPSERTNFVITMDSDSDNSGTFDILEEAKRSIVECRDYLEGCCETEGFGSHISTIEKGVATKEGDNWRVEAKLRVKFDE